MSLISVSPATNEYAVFNASIIISSCVSVVVYCLSGFLTPNFSIISSVIASFAYVYTLSLVPPSSFTTAKASGALEIWCLLQYIINLLTSSYATILPTFKKIIDNIPCCT